MLIIGREVGQGVLIGDGGLIVDDRIRGAVLFQWWCRSTSDRGSMELPNDDVWEMDFGDGEFSVKIMDRRDTSVRIGFNAPPAISILRLELLDENQRAEMLPGWVRKTL